jgi:hypothetical protein
VVERLSSMLEAQGSILSTAKKKKILEKKKKRCVVLQSLNIALK